MKRHQKPCDHTPHGLTWANNPYKTRLYQMLNGHWGWYCHRCRKTIILGTPESRRVAKYWQDLYIQQICRETAEAMIASPV